MPDPVIMKQFEQLPVEIHPDNDSLGLAAARRAAAILIAALEQAPTANLIVATGNSQLSFYRHLVAQPGIDWPRVRVFHMDEYAGMQPDHPASFRRYLHERFIDLVRPRAFYGVKGEAPSLPGECRRYASLLGRFPADLCCLGIGENGHLAFNDPPYADFADPQRVKLVALDPRSRQQQVGEGHFARLEDVPTHAISLTIPALLAARQVLAIVPEGRKAAAVKAALLGPITASCPASILRKTPQARLYLDHESAELIL